MFGQSSPSPRQQAIQAPFSDLSALKPQPTEGISLLDVCGSSGSSGSGSSLDGEGPADITPRKPVTPARTSASASLQRKFVDMLGPLLAGSSKRTAAASPPPASPVGTGGDTPRAPTGRAECKGDKMASDNLSPLTANAKKLNRTSSHHSGLLDYVNKMTISDVFSTSTSRSKASAASEQPTGHHLPAAAVAAAVAAASESNQSPSLMTPSLERLLSAARHCNLPPSPRTPEPGTPNYQTILLSLSLTVPPRMQRKNWCLDDYTVLEKLYTGYASTVFKAICKLSGETVVLKVYTLAAVCDLYKYQIYREVRVHAALQHENIVHLYASFQEGDKVIMVEEYADGADLFTLLHKYGGRLSERLAVQMVLEPFMRVLQFLHSRGIIHRDIKPENIMFNKNMCLKLGDFGLAIDLREERAVTRAGTLDYMAPEVLKCPFKSRPEENKDNNRLHYSARVDSWALGVLTYELLVGFPPFFDQSRKSTEERILTSTPAYPPGMSEEARCFLEQSLSKNAVERPTILEMLHHAWVENYRSRRSMRQIPPSTAMPTSSSSASAASRQHAQQLLQAPLSARKPGQVAGAQVIAVRPQDGVLQIRVMSAKPAASTPTAPGPTPFPRNLASIMSTINDVGAAPMASVHRKAPETTSSAAAAPMASSSPRVPAGDASVYMSTSRLSPQLSKTMSPAPIQAQHQQMGTYSAC